LGNPAPSSRDAEDTRVVVGPLLPLYRQQGANHAYAGSSGRRSISTIRTKPVAQLRSGW